MSSQIGLGLGSLAIEAIFGYAGAALFTTINPVIGGLFGISSSVITSIAKAIFDQVRLGSPVAKTIVANTIGILGGAAVVGLIAGTTLTVGAGLSLFISILAAKIIFSLGVILFCGCLVRQRI